MNLGKYTRIMKGGAYLVFLGRNRFLNQGLGLGDGEAAGLNAGANTEFLNQANLPMPAGMQRFLAKKGINSPEDLNNRLQFAPRMSFRKSR